MSLMIVGDLFALLSDGELSNFSLANDGDGTIKGRWAYKIGRYLNDGLFRLYSRFQLKESVLTIATQDGRNYYHLRRKFAESNTDSSASDSPFIVDSEDSPFIGDVIKILEVRDSEDNIRVLDSPNNKESLFTVQNDTLRVPKPEDEDKLFITYQASHPKVDVCDIDQPLELPEYLVEALLVFVASKVYASMGGQENTAISQQYRMAYEDLCRHVTTSGLQNSMTGYAEPKFADRGFL